MKKGLAGMGLVASVIALAIVLLLTARAWRAVAPTAAQTLRSGPAAAADHGQPAAGEAIRSGNLPDVSEMKRETNRHAADVAEASKASNQ